jgi:EpsI family protein
MSNSVPSSDIPWKRCLVVVVLAGLTVWASLINQAPTSATESGVIMNLPNLVGDFWGIDQETSLTEKTLLPPDTEFAKKAYQSPDGREIVCQIVLSGAEKRSIHRPEVCLPGQGWTIESSEIIPVPLKPGGALSVMKLTLSREFELSARNRKKVTMYFLYWFIGKDKTTADHKVRILLTSWDRIMHNMNHRWAYVIVSAPVTENLRPGGLNSQQTMEMLKDFIGTIAPAIIKPGVVVR